MKNIASYLEHTLLSPVVTEKQIDKLIEEANSYSFVGVCVPPYWVKRVRRNLASPQQAVVTVIGFPFGYNRTDTKIREIEVALADGADEVDMVMTLSAFASGNDHWVKTEIARAAQCAHEAEKLLKVIIETAYWSAEQTLRAAQLCAQGGADFVKTSTGFASAGAQLKDVRLLREALPLEIGIKASGGIRTLEQAVAFIEAGAERIGTSAGVSICQAAL
ncbi:MAG: deoxyribose-phosphate aldolase [Bernardetiaceae bacterium]|nr:deoxyribose-phosphate aldolase [Bernardetiaceae bacterium]